MNKNKKNLIISSIGLITTSISVATFALLNNTLNNNTNFYSESSTKIANEEIVAKPLAREKTAWGWKVNDITDENFYNLPKSGNGKIVKIVSVDNYPNEAKIDINIQFSSMTNDQVSIVNETKIYSVTGFKKETLNEKVDRLYSEEIIPTKQALQIPAIEENWTLADINDKNFKNLPVSKEGIEVKLLSLQFDNSDLLEGKMILNYSFSWYEGVNTIEKSFEVSGFDASSYNSNVAAQNHYKLVALYRMLSLKSDADISTISTDDVEQEGIDIVKKYFDVPEDRKFNVVTLDEVISPQDNTYDSYIKGKNMKLGTIKLNFSIFDWVNNVRTKVETQLFQGFENPLEFWEKKFSSNITLSSQISSSLFSFDKFYNIGASSTTKNNETGEIILNATNSKKTGWTTLSSYLLPLSDWVGYKLSTYSPMYGHGESAFGLKNVSPNHKNFVDMITYDTKNNYLGEGPDKYNSIDKPIAKGGVTEILRRYLFNSTSNQELYDYDWVVFKSIVEPENIPNSLVWDSYDSNGMPFGSYSVWAKMQFQYDVWVDYEKTTIKFNVSLGMVDAGKISTSFPKDGKWIKTY